MRSASGRQIARESHTDAAKVNGFLAQLDRLTKQRRVATQPRDYVLAVWVDCPGYKFLQAYRQMSLCLLLEDALLQLERRHGILLIANAPVGMFDAVQSEGLLWRPSRYLDLSGLDLSDPQSARDIYGVIVGVELLCVYDTGRDGKMKLSVGHPNGQPSTHQVFDYNETFSGIFCADALDFMVKVCSWWSWNTNNAVSDPQILTRPILNYDAAAMRELQDAFNHFLHALIHRIIYTVAERSGLSVSNVERVVAQQQTLANSIDAGSSLPPGRGADHHTIVYLIVCKALGLKLDFAMKKNLRIMVDLGTDDLPPRLGLSSVNLGELRDVATYTVCAVPPEDLEKQSQKPAMFEVRLREDSGGSKQEQETPKYEVVGIWVSPLGYPTQGIQLLAPVREGLSEAEGT